MLGIEDDIAGAQAITGCKNYNIEEMRRMVFDGTRPPIIVEIEEISLPEGMVLAEIFQHIGAVNRGGLGVDMMYLSFLT